VDEESIPLLSILGIEGLAAQETIAMLWLMIIAFHGLETVLKVYIRDSSLERWTQSTNPDDGDHHQNP